MNKQGVDAGELNIVIVVASVNGNTKRGGFMRYVHTKPPQKHLSKCAEANVFLCFWAGEMRVVAIWICVTALSANLKIEIVTSSDQLRQSSEKAYNQFDKLG